MRPFAKVGIVAAGYVLAFVIAWITVAVYVAATSGPDRQTYAGMFDFGDSLLFLGVLAVAAVPATAAALFFLRPFPSFWIALSGVALAIAGTDLAATIAYLAQRSLPPGSSLHAWSALAVLRILIAPCFVLAFLVSAALAPSRGSRIALLVACGIEAVAFTTIALLWFHPLSHPLAERSSIERGHEGSPRAFRSSAEGTRHSCPDCGTQLYYTDSRQLPAEVDPRLASVSLTTLDEPAVIRPQVHQWWADHLPWFDTRDDLLRVADGRLPHPEHRR